MSMSLHPEYISKIQGFIGLSGAVFQGNTSNPVFKAISPFVKLQQVLYFYLNYKLMILVFETFIKLYVCFFYLGHS